MTEVTRALEQIAEIHQQLAKSAVYRGWRSVPVACSGVLGLAAAAWVSAAARPIDAWSFAAYWTTVGGVALPVGCSEILWHYFTQADAHEQSRSRHVVGQFLPALVGGALITATFVRLSPALV